MQTISTQDDTLLDLSQLSRYLLSHWKWFLVLGFGSAIAFALASLYIPNRYSSETVLVSAESGTNLEGVAGQLGGLAGLAGVELGGKQDKTLLALQVLKSRQFLVSFVKQHKLEVYLFAATKWDKKTESYHYDEDKYDFDSKVWLSRPDRPITYYPTDMEIHEEMLSLLDIEEDSTNEVTRVRFSYYNPEMAQTWLSLLIGDLNENIRADEIYEREEQIGFLQLQLEKEYSAELRNVFYGLIEDQLKSSTLAKARSEYVFKVIDPAIFPEEKASPQRALIAILGGLVGGVLCFIFFSLCFVVKSRD